MINIRFVGLISNITALFLSRLSGFPDSPLDQGLILGMAVSMTIMGAALLITSFWYKEIKFIKDGV